MKRDKGSSFINSHHLSSIDPNPPIPSYTTKTLPHPGKAMPLCTTWRNVSMPVFFQDFKEDHTIRASPLWLSPWNKPIHPSFFQPKICLFVVEVWGPQLVCLVNLLDWISSVEPESHVSKRPLLVWFLPIFGWGFNLHRFDRGFIYRYCRYWRPFGPPTIFSRL